MTENYHVIRDTVAPTISMSDVTIKDTEATSYNLMTGVSVADNSGVTPSVTTSGSLSSTPGTYTITYTVRDAAGNVRTASRNITVEIPYDETTFYWSVPFCNEYNQCIDPEKYTRFVTTNAGLSGYRSWAQGYGGTKGTIKSDKKCYIRRGSTSADRFYRMIWRVVDEYSTSYAICTGLGCPSASEACPKSIEEYADYLIGIYGNGTPTVRYINDNIDY